MRNRPRFCDGSSRPFRRRTTDIPQEVVINVPWSAHILEELDQLQCRAVVRRGQRGIAHDVGEPHGDEPPRRARGGRGRCTHAASAPRPPPEGRYAKQRGGYVDTVNSGQINGYTIIRRVAGAARAFSRRRRHPVGPPQRDNRSDHDDPGPRAPPLTYPYPLHLPSHSHLLSSLTPPPPLVPNPLTPTNSPPHPPHNLLGEPRDSWPKPT